MLVDIVADRVDLVDIGVHVGHGGYSEIRSNNFNINILI